MRVTALLLALLAPATTVAETKLHTLFTDGMVLQRDLPCKVWGTAAAGEEVVVEIAGQKKSAKAGADGRWSVKLDPLPAGGPHELKAGGVTVKDVLVGEVWVCSGQSNMEWSVNASANPAEEKAAAKYPKLRLYTVPKKMADTPQTEVASAWKVCSPETVGGFSAVAYYFGRDLLSLDVPVGLIHTSWGGTAAELWTKHEVLAGTPELKPIVDEFPNRLKNYETALANHPKAVEKAKAENKPAPQAPRKPMGPSCLYNAMIAPILPYGIRGAIWYQGESNASRAKQYETLFPAMIRNWRDDWGQGDFPFGFVQLANFMARKPEPGQSNWAELRDAQTKTLALPNTGMAVIIDIGDEKDIHPKNKQDVGKRLAAWAQAKVYGKPIVYSGPMFEALKVEGTSARVTFKHAGGGLVAKGEVLKGFAIAGEDGKFVWADAKIDGATVVVSSPKVEKPAAVRYAWADNPECNLYNKEGFPASPFRTDK
jgi:sialate O-acetylesterase